MLTDIKLPTMEQLSDRANAESIKSYLASLNDRLRYMMLNVDHENLSEGLSTTIKDASDNADTAIKEVEYIKESLIALDESFSKITQTADKVNWLISDGNSSTDFTLTGYAAKLITDTLDVKGYVKISDLAESGKTVIDGGNIRTGSISADKLSVDDLSAISATVGGWSITDSAISASASGYGSLTLNSPKSGDPYWLKAVSSYGYTTFYIAKNGACYIDGSYIGNGTVTASKISTDSQSRLDLTNNYNGVKMGSGVVITDGNVERRLFVNPQGVLTFDTGGGNTAFSLGLNRDGNAYSLAVLNGSGQTVGTIPLS